MNEIKMIPIGELMHHPENPRIDLGDLTELTDSIRANGILQNLTVVADIVRAKYLVVIGNRRFEAAKAAGLVELPCYISNMSHEEQIATMLQENMQRQDLTVYEQAQGFQMMMNLGFTEEQISDRTGISKTTVKRRLKMAEMDAETLKKVCDENGTGSRQINLADFDRLSRIDDVEKRNELLAEIGTSDFNWDFGKAYQEQECKKVLPEVKQLIRKAKITMLPEGKRWSSEYEHHVKWDVKLYEWHSGDALIPETDEELFYLLDRDNELEFYTKRKRAEPVRKTEEEKAEEKRIAEAWAHAEADADHAAQLRREFADGLTIPKNGMGKMMHHMLIAAVLNELNYCNVNGNIKTLFNLETVMYEERNAQAIDKLWAMPINEWPKVIRCFFDGENMRRYFDGWRKEMPRYKKNQVLDEYYEWLKEFGYEMSDVEIQMQNGTYPYFRKPDPTPPKTEEPEEEDDGKEADSAD